MLEFKLGCYRTIFGPDMVQEAEEQVRLIQANLKIAQSRQKSYDDKRSSPLVLKSVTTSI